MHAHKALQQLADHFRIGKILKVTTLDGARKNAVTKLNTDQGQYVIKTLFVSEPVRDYLSLIETKEQSTKQISTMGLPAVPAITINEKAIYTRDHQHHLLFPYIEGSIKSPNTITLKHSQALGAFLADLHDLNLQRTKEADWTFTLEPGLWEVAARTLPMIKQMLPIVIDTFRAYDHSLKEMTSDIVVTHRDIDPNNIIWKKDDSFAVIDWELLGPMDAAVELMYMSIQFSLHDNIFNPHIYHTIFESYQQRRPLKHNTPQDLLHHVLVMNFSWIQKQLPILTKLNMEDKKFIQIANSFKATFVSAAFLLNHQHLLN